MNPKGATITLPQDVSLERWIIIYSDHTIKDAFTKYIPRKRGGICPDAKRKVIKNK